MKICPKCQREFIHPQNQFCGRSCANASKWVNRSRKQLTKVCEGCQGIFHPSLKHPEQRYCDRACYGSAVSRRYRIDSTYFQELDASKAYVLGQLWVGGWIVTPTELRIYGSFEGLTSILTALRSTYRIRKTKHQPFGIGTHVVILADAVFIDSLMGYGLDHPWDREFPWIPGKYYEAFRGGYESLSESKVVANQTWIAMGSRMLALEWGNQFGGRPWYMEGKWWVISKISLN